MNYKILQQMKKEELIVMIKDLLMERKVLTNKIRELQGHKTKVKMDSFVYV